MKSTVPPPTETCRCVSSGFRSGVRETFALLGCYAAYIGSCLPTFRDNLPGPSSNVKLNGTDRLTRDVDMYQPTLRNIPEERRSQNLLFFDQRSILCEMKNAYNFHVDFLAMIFVSTVTLTFCLNTVQAVVKTPLNRVINSEQCLYQQNSCLCLTRGYEFAGLQQNLTVQTSVNVCLLDYMYIPSDQLAVTVREAIITNPHQSAHITCPCLPCLEIFAALGGPFSDEGGKTTTTFITGVRLVDPCLAEAPQASPN